MSSRDSWLATLDITGPIPTLTGMSTPTPLAANHPSRTQNVIACIALNVGGSIPALELQALSDACVMNPMVPEHFILTGAAGRELMSRARILTREWTVPCDIALFDFDWSGRNSGQAFGPLLLDTIAPLINGRIELALVWSDMSLTGLTILNHRAYESEVVIGLETSVPPPVTSKPTVTLRKTGTGLTIRDAKTGQSSILVMGRDRLEEIRRVQESTHKIARSAVRGRQADTVMLYDESHYAGQTYQTVSEHAHACSARERDREQDAPMRHASDDDAPTTQHSRHIERPAALPVLNVTTPVPKEITSLPDAAWDDLLPKASASTSHGPRFGYHEAVEVPSSHTHHSHSHESSCSSHSSHTDSSCGGQSSCGSSCGGGGGGD